MTEIINVSSDEESSSHFSNIEIAVVTALQNELDALIGYSAKHQIIIGENRVYHKFFFSIEGKEFAVLGYTANKMGIPMMAISLMELTHAFPGLKYIALIGIAAGSDSSTQSFGDLLIPKIVFNYEMGKYIEDESGLMAFRSDFSAFYIDEDIYQKIMAVANNSHIVDLVWEALPTKKDHKIKIHSGNLICGSAVIASKEKVREIERAVARKYIGIDMESYAIAAVNALKNGQFPKLFVIKAISDFADSNKDDSEQEYAKVISAGFLIHVCSNVLITNPINSITLDSKTIEPGKTGKSLEFEKYKEISREFDSISIQDLTERVDKKEQISIQLAELIVSKNLSKSDILKLYSEGSFVGLILSIILNPQSSDKLLLFGNIDRAKQFFTKHKMLEAIEKLLNRNIINKEDYIKLKDIFYFFYIGADESLAKKLRYMETLVDANLIIKTYSIENNNIRQNENLKVNSGNPRFGVLKDELFKSVFHIEGDFTDSSDITMDSSGQQVSVLEYTFVNFKDLKLYAHVKCKLRETDEMRELWIAFSNELITISKQKGASEKAYPVKSKELRQGWKEVSVNLKNCVQQLFGEDGIEYLNLINVRIRGSGKIANIVIR
jgi:nucleoside phosphorylase